MQKVILICGTAGIGALVCRQLLELGEAAREATELLEEQRLARLPWGEWHMEVVVKQIVAEAAELAEFFKEPIRSIPEPTPYRGYMSGRRRYK